MRPATRTNGCDPTALPEAEQTRGPSGVPSEIQARSSPPDSRRAKLGHGGRSGFEVGARPMTVTAIGARGQRVCGTSRPGGRFQGRFGEWIRTTWHRPITHGGGLLSMSTKSPWVVALLKSPSNASFESALIGRLNSWTRYNRFV